MVRFAIRFPLGVYHALALDGEGEPEWPPSPLRLVGALLAAAHRPGSPDPTGDRQLLQRLCESGLPVVLAPGSVAVGEQMHDDEAVRLRGATRWAPRNYVSGPISPRNLGRERAAVSKAGVAIGDRELSILWPVELDDADLARLRLLVAEVAFLGTSRSPVVMRVERAGTEQKGEQCEGARVWEPLDDDSAREGMVALRVPDAETITAFDRRHDARASAKPRVESAGFVPSIAIGRDVLYAPQGGGEASAEPIDPRWWGEMIVVAIDRDASEVLPKAPSAYLLARAARVALLGAYAPEGSPGEAPPILRGRDEEPHCAIVALPHVFGPHPDHVVAGLAIVLPHRNRVPDVVEQRLRVIDGLNGLCDATQGKARRHVAIPGAGRIWLRWPDRSQAQSQTLSGYRYAAAARCWRSVTPIVHSRWRKARDGALAGQIAADCAHVGLPQPAEVEVLRGAARMVAPKMVPASWRGLLSGPAENLRITFDRPVRGPVLLGRARHFGLGLCVPEWPAPAAEPQEEQ